MQTGGAFARPVFCFLAKREIIKCEIGNISLVLKMGRATKSDEFLEKCRTAFDPPLIFGKLCCNFFQNGYGRIYEPLSYISFYQFHAQKALIKCPKSAI